MRYKLLAITILFIISAGAASASDCVIKGATFCNGPDYAPAIFPTNSDACGSAGSQAQDNQNVVCCCPTNIAQTNEGQITSDKTGAMTASAVSNTPEKKPFDILNPLENLQVKIPGLDAISEKYPATCNDDNGPTTCQLPFIAIYITALYNYAMGAIGILAAIALMIGGMLWLVSAGNATRIAQAKNWIGGAITGVIIMSTSYILLNEINPELIGLKSINLEIVEEVPLPENGSESDYAMNATASGQTSANFSPIALPPGCPTSADLVSFADLVESNASGKSLRPEAIVGLKKAIEVATKYNVKLYVTSGSRTYAYQQQLYDAGLKKHGASLVGKYVSKPSCESPHIKGIAIDLCIKGTASCTKLKSEYAKTSDADIAKLQKIMAEAGWSRYCGEWWHFQYGVKPKVSCSP